MSRVYNFSAGPAVLPEEVLKEAHEEMLDYRGSFCTPPRRHLIMSCMFLSSSGHQMVMENNIREY